MEKLLLVEPALELLRSKPMSAVGVPEPGTHALLVIGIRNMAEVEKEGRHLVLHPLERGMRCPA